MKAISIYRTVITLLIICMPLVAMAQGTFDSKKKSNHIHNTSTLKPIKKDGSVRADDVRLPVTVVQQSRMKNTVSGNLATQRVLARKDFKKVIYSPETNVPIFIQTIPDGSHAVKSTELKPSQQCFNYLNKLKALLKTERPEDHFVITRSSTDRFNKTHIRLDQVYKGIPVYGGEVIVHLDRNGEGELFNGRFFPVRVDINTSPVITTDMAVEKATMHLYKGNKKEIKGPVFDFIASLEQPVSSLVIYRTKAPVPEFMLAYHVTLFAANHHRWEYFIDAINGNVIHYFEHNYSANGKRTATAKDLNNVTRTVNTYEYGSNFYLIDLSKPMYTSPTFVKPDDLEGAIITIDMNNTYGYNQAFYYVTSATNTWTDPKAVSAHYNAATSYDYYYQKHGRNSIDGKGGSIISIVNVADDNGQPMDNAYWNGRFICYGNGDEAFKPLAGSLDVGGHELTHGVVENTANLEYEGESGAINESMADVFGSMIENEDWLMGEDIVRTEVFPSGALRSMSDPHNGGSSLSDAGYQPSHMDEKYTGSQDNYGVHINAGICNLAYYLYAQAIGKETAAEIYYKTLDHYLTKSSQFIDLRLAVIQAASEMYGAGSNQVTQAGIAFDAVGITNGEGTQTNPTLPENPGDEYMLVYNMDPADYNTLYRAVETGTEGEYDFTPLTSTLFISRPSVTDDGVAAIFVAGDNTLHSIITSPEYETEEYVIQDEPIWSNAVVSKDGNRVAAVTTDADASIYVYDYDSEAWYTFGLYNPTYTLGVEGYGVLYADALEFDYSGEFLVYDAYNILENNDGDPIEYWDVNFIRVWNYSTNSAGDGTIYKLFSSIPEGVSIGNPSFSKNSSNILAFDYWDQESDEFAMLGCNIETNEVKTVAENNYLGWPSYNKVDSRIAFTSLDLVSEFPDTVYLVDYVNLNTDKISSGGIHQGMFIDGAWPVYFSTGYRNTAIKETNGDIPVRKIHGYPNPFKETFTVEIPKELSLRCTLEVLNQTGQVVFTGFYDKVEGDNLTIHLKGLPSGYFMLRLWNNESVAAGKIIKMD
ncbi:MAG: M4 family metallopeptidase [Bacteroidales bacterium]|nr:M4 family metallopeptidase [Bacteroidales bacterium]